ncbi:MAG: site-specific DNA-methyltransferase, partial [Fervidobacterium sp.]
MSKEQKFFDALKDIFVGAKVEGESGYINLMRIKSKYFEEGVFPKLQKDIDESLKPFPEFREELFEKLYTFFNRYFSESGSIYFSYTPVHQNVYEKVYTDDKDVILFWKTNMLYYVKTDILFKNLEVETDGFKFFFDVSTLKHKKAFEKREIVYEFKEIRKDGTLIFNVYYSEKGRQTKIDEILRALQKKRVKITEDILERAFRVFEKQTKVDYFINKNAKDFLREQFNLWLYQYVYSGESEWTEKRIRQLQTLKDIAFKIIDFISQFEEELIKIWNKPKFVLNSNYVIALRTLKRLVDEDDFSELRNFAINRMLTNGDYRQDLTETIKEIYKRPLENIYVDNVKFSDSKIELTYVRKFKSIEDAEDFLKSNGRSKDEIVREKSEEGEEY